MANNNYNDIVKEMETGTFRKEVWLKAVEKAGGKQSLATSIYISLRAEELYTEKTSWPMRVLRGVSQMFDPRTRKGVFACATVVFGISLSALILAQPALQQRAGRDYNDLVGKAKDCVGLNQQELIQRLGPPAKIDDTRSNFLVYVYNPSSAFYFGQKRFEFRMFFDPRTARVAGWEENPLLRTTAALD